jgi:hypothetical protein
VFFYQPGCNGYPLLHGNANGADVDDLYNTTITSPILGSGRAWFYGESALSS